MTHREPERRDGTQRVQTESSPDLHRRDGQIRTVRAKDVLGTDDVVRIDLDGEIYTLRLTRNRRLILTK